MTFIHQHKNIRAIIEALLVLYGRAEFIDNGEDNAFVTLTDLLGKSFT
ncbi:hypothetical protein MGSAQ_000393 [marine sediment metagenome]|uniref:Uncharacterized protein n=1 Tax=marine sediment metagenome TaxID=412755 RepID=A0A1B6NXD4_9ZZZZ